MKITLKNIIVPSIPLAVLLILGCLGIWFSFNMGAQFLISRPQNAGSLSQVDSFINPNSLLSSILSLAFTLLNAFLMSQINNRFTIIRTRTFLPIVTFMLLMASWNETHIANSSHLALTLVILSIFYFFSMFRDKNASEQSFVGSFLISISSMLINPFIFLIPICWIGFIIFQSFSLRTFLASVFGTIAPWLLFLVVRYLLFDKIDFVQLFELKPNLALNLTGFSLPLIIYSAVFVFYVLVSILGVFSLSNSDSIQTRNKLNFLIFLLVSLLIMTFIFRNQFSLFLPLIAFVFAILFSHPFTLRPSNFYGILFLIFCVLNIAFVITKYIPI